MTDQRGFDEGSDGGSPGGSHHEVVDEGPPPGADIASELNEEQAHASEVAGRGASAGELARALEEQKDRYLRLAAEFENFRRRTNRERLELGTRAQAELASTLLEPLDDLARVLSVDLGATDAASVVQGVELVSRKLSKSLAAAGLEVVDPEGQPFDPAFHEAISTEAAGTEQEDDIVSAVFQPGYRFKGLLLRPARVVVKKWNG